MQRECVPVRNCRSRCCTSGPVTKAGCHCLWSVCSLSSKGSPLHVFILQPAVDQGKRYSLGWIPKNGYSWALLTWSPPCGFPIFLGIRMKTKEAEFRNSNGFSNMWDISQTLTSCRHKSCSAFHVHTSPILNPEQTAKLFPRRTRSVMCISWVISRAQPCRTASKHMLGLKQGARARALGLRAVLMSKWFPQLWLEAWDEDGLCAEIYGLCLFGGFQGMSPPQLSPLCH